jgi:hypothetical protein
MTVNLCDVEKKLQISFQNTGVPKIDIVATFLPLKMFTIISGNRHNRLRQRNHQRFESRFGN